MEISKLNKVDKKLIVRKPSLGIDEPPKIELSPIDIATQESSQCDISPLSDSGGRKLGAQQKMAQFEKESFIGKDTEYEIPTKRKESRL